LGIAEPCFKETTLSHPTISDVSFTVIISGAKVILQDHVENWLACVRQPGLLSCGMPSGKAKAPVGKGIRPGGAEMGTASNSDPLGPVICDSLQGISYIPRWVKVMNTYG